MRIAHGTLVAVVDGAKLLFFRNDGDAERLDLRTVEHQIQKDAPTRDQGTDKPGRTDAGGGHGRGHAESGAITGHSAYAETDFHQQSEDRFAAHAAELLERAAMEGWADKIVVVAAPKTLGEMRKHYGNHLKAKLEHEAAKDLTGLPVNAIEEHLAKIGANGS